jgi:hypothetical protein
MRTACFFSFEIFLLLPIQVVQVLVLPSNRVLKVIILQSNEVLAIFDFQEASEVLQVTHAPHGVELCICEESSAGETNAPCTTLGSTTQLYQARILFPSDRPILTVRILFIRALFVVGTIRFDIIVLIIFDCEQLSSTAWTARYVLVVSMTPLAQTGCAQDMLTPIGSAEPSWWMLGTEGFEADVALLDNFHIGIDLGSASLICHGQARAGAGR